MPVAGSHGSAVGAIPDCVRPPTIGTDPLFNVLLVAAYLCAVMVLTLSVKVWPPDHRFPRCLSRLPKRSSVSEPPASSTLPSASNAATWKTRSDRINATIAMKWSEAGSYNLAFAEPARHCRERRPRCSRSALASDAGSVSRHQNGGVIEQSGPMLGPRRRTKHQVGLSAPITCKSWKMI